jgi:hypothetical protein
MENAEQERRRDLYHELIAAGNYQQGWVMWIHFTDEQLGRFNLDSLIENGLVVRVPELQYQPTGTWKDYFPPQAYALTPKAIMIKRNPHLWVIEGKWESEQKRSGE